MIFCFSFFLALFSFFFLFFDPVHIKFISTSFLSLERWRTPPSSFLIPTPFMPMIYNHLCPPLTLLIHLTIFLWTLWCCHQTYLSILTIFLPCEHSALISLSIMPSSLVLFYLLVYSSFMSMPSYDYMPLCL